jgi:hypothetical protein
MNHFNPRIFHLAFAFGVYLLASVLPYWVVSIALAAGFLLFEQFYEGVVAGLLLDIFYGSNSIAWFPFPLAAAALVLLLALPFVKRRLVFWPSVRF